MSRSHDHSASLLEDNEGFLHCNDEHELDEALLLSGDWDTENSSFLQPLYSNEPAANLDVLDGLRGFSSVIIVVGHFLTFWSPDSLPPADWPRFGLDFLSAVTLFFVMSGFTLVCVYDPHCNDLLTERPLATKATKRAFFRKRFLRLAPMYYLGLLIAIPPLVIYKDSTEIAISVPVALLWLQSMALHGYAWNGPLWNVSAFAFCYLCFPLLLRSRSLTRPQLLWAIGGCTILSWASYLVVAVLLGQPDALHVYAIARMPHFAIGVLSGVLAHKCALPRPTAAAEACTAVMLLDLAACAAAGTGDIGAWNAYAHAAEFALPPVMALWVAALTRPGCGGPTRAALLSPPARALGRWSYALYCLHFPIISGCAWAAAGRGVSAAAVPGFEAAGATFFFCFPTWAAAPVLAICLVCAAAAHALVEEPARRWLTARTARPSAAAAAAADDDDDAVGPADERAAAAGGLPAERA